MRRCTGFLAALVLAAGGVLVPGVHAAEVMVYAAVSLTEALQANAAAYEPTSGDRLVFNLGASNALARQIQAGAPADVFFSADEAKMDDLEKKGLLLAGTRKSVLSNVLAIVVENGARLDLASAADLVRPAIRHIAIAEPSTVPAGIYAKQYLKQLDLWNAVIDKLVPTENVRAALAAVESGNCEAGIVYRTDARISKRVQVAFEVPRAEGPRISYPIAAIAASRQPEAARRLVAYLGSPAAAQVFLAHGFLVDDAKP